MMLMPTIFGFGRNIRMAPLLIAGMAAIGTLLIACSTTPQRETADNGLIWETWNLVMESYVAADSMDSEQIAGGIIFSMLEAADQPSYPFLTELSDVRIRRPSNVPLELIDVWKAWTLLLEKQSGVDPDLLSKAAVRGLVTSLEDSSAAYLTPEDYDRAREATSSSYEGIGTFVSVISGRIILSPNPGGPAERAGIQDGDVLLGVDGQSVEELTTREVANLVRGAAGSRVKLTMERPGVEGELEFDLLRGTLDIPTVDVQLLPGAIGYIFIGEFRENTSSEVLDVLEQLKQAEMLALILDLRDNPGGAEEAARDVASQFLAGGLFMYEVDREGNRTDWPIIEGGIATKELPLAVMVSEFTTGVAEMLASTLQDTSRATVLGVQTAGSASANSFLELSDGSAISLAVSRWYTPLDNPIHGLGVTPDIDVPLTQADLAAGIDAQLIEAYDYLDDLLPPFR